MIAARPPPRRRRRRAGRAARPAPRRCARPAAARRSRRSRRRRRAPAGTPSAAAAASTVACTAARPAPPVKALALPEFTRMANPPSPAAPGVQRGELLLAPEHRRGAGGGAGEDPGERRARRDLGQHHVEPALVADPRLGGGEAHARRSAAASGSRPPAPAARPAGRACARPARAASLPSHGGRLSWSEARSRGSPPAAAPVSGRSIVARRRASASSLACSASWRSWFSMSARTWSSGGGAALALARSA